MTTTAPRQTCELATLARHPLVYRHKFGLQNHDRRDTLATDLRLTCDVCDRLATDLRPGRDRLELLMSLDKSLHEIKNSGVTCDRFTSVPNDIRGTRVNYDRPAETCDQRRIQLRVGSLASEIDNFHDRFWCLKRSWSLSISMAIRSELLRVSRGN